MKEKKTRFKLEIHNKETQQIKNFLNRTGTGIRQTQNVWIETENIQKSNLLKLKPYLAGPERLIRN